MSVVKMSDLKQVTKLVKVSPPAFEGIVIDVRYAPGRFTPKMEDDMLDMIDVVQELENSDGEDQRSKIKSAKNYLANILCNIMTDWNLSDDDGKILDINQETLYDTPYAVMRPIFEAIKKDMDPNQTISSS